MEIVNGTKGIIFDDALKIQFPSALIDERARVST
jgi:hypothetical protein